MRSIKTFLSTAAAAGLVLATVHAQDQQEQPNQRLNQGQNQNQPQNPNQRLQPGQNPNTPAARTGQVDAKAKEWLRKTIEAGQLEVKLGQLAIEASTNPSVKELGRSLVNDHAQLNAKVQALAAKLGVSQTLSQTRGQLQPGQPAQTSPTQPGQTPQEDRAQTQPRSPSDIDPNEPPSPTGREEVERRQGPQDLNQSNPQTKGLRGQILSKEHQETYDRLSRLKGGQFDQQFLATVIQQHQKDIQHFQTGQRELQNPEIKMLISQGLPHLQQHLRKAQQVQQQLGGAQGSQQQGQGAPDEPSQDAPPSPQ